MLHIRPAVASDAVDLHRLIVDLATYEREPDAVQVDAPTLGRQLGASPAPFECLLATTDSDEIVGFALFFHNYSTWRGRRGLYLEDLFVPEPHRGAGVGRRLLQELAAIAVSRGCARMEWAVLDWNTAAIGFYERLGAQAMTDWTTFRLCDEALHNLAASGNDH